MDLKAALLATAGAGAFLLVAACGGGSDTASSTSTASSPSTPSSAPIVARSCECRCQRLSETTYLGGNLFVAEQGSVGVTLLSDGGMSPLTLGSAYPGFGGGFMILYNNVFGMQAASNPQDKFGTAKAFPADAVVGTSAQVQLSPPPPDFIVGPVASTYPKGIPLQLWLKLTDGNPPGPGNSSGTASIGKDFFPESFPTASVTYGTNNTATVTFFVTTDGVRLTDGSHYSVGLTNVYGTGCPNT
jgi:hypothetical protein